MESVASLWSVPDRDCILLSPNLPQSFSLKQTLLLRGSSSAKLSHRRLGDCYLLSLAFHSQSSLYSFLQRTGGCQGPHGRPTEHHASSFVITFPPVSFTSASIHNVGTVLCFACFTGCHYPAPFLQFSHSFSLTTFAFWLRHSPVQYSVLFLRALSLAA